MTTSAMVGLFRSSPKLDPQFVALGRFHRREAQRARESGSPNVLRLALERENGNVTTFETPIGDVRKASTLFHAERMTKFLLWSAGGWRLHVAAPPEVTAHLTRVYSRGGERSFDVDLMEKVYEKTFQVAATAPGELPAERNSGATVGGKVDGCRLGFDLGASYCKVAAVENGEVVFTDAFPWNPADQADPDYHFRHIDKSLRIAAAYLPRVDSIGGSSAGVIVANRFMVSSLLRGLRPEKMAEGRDLFLRLAEEWGVPLTVANDGDVTALVGATSLGVKGLLGIAMGSSQAGGYINPQGQMTGWINELAFAPVDASETAACDEWSKDRGVGAQYFSQQAASRLISAAGISLPPGLKTPERLNQIQTLMGEKNPQAESIYETIGAYLGHALPLYAEFYDFQHVLILGGLTLGNGGGILLDTARKVLARDYPEMAASTSLHLPNGNWRSTGPAVAAASLGVSL
jgi:predicted NBD/HSP70 family sugar kinase